jgi:hypothetical protein
MMANNIKAFPVHVTRLENGQHSKAPAVKKGTDWRDAANEINALSEINADNVGLILPDDVCIIDLDIYKGVTREDIEKALDCSLEWDEALIQTTPSGGEHYAFLTPVPVRQGSDLLDVKGFDTRTNKGWIATGKGYQDQTLFDMVDTLNARDIPSLPATALSKLKNNNTDDLDDLEQLIEDRELDITDDEAKHFIEALPISTSSGPTWLTVAQAIRHQFKGTPERDEMGWELFDKFSKQCPDEYNEKQNRARYFSFERSKTGSKTTFATVIHLAGGWDAIKEQSAQQLIEQTEQVTNSDELTEMFERAVNVNDPLKQDQLLKTLQKTVEKVKGYKPTISALKKEIAKLRAVNTNAKRDYNFIDDYVYIEVENAYMNRKTGSAINERAFNTKFNRITPLTNDGDKQNASQYANDTIPTFYNVMYMPQCQQEFTLDGEEYFNIFSPFGFDTLTSSDIVERVKNHIALLLPDEKEQQIFINYLAHNVQHPGKKIQWAIVLQGVQGDGKSFFAEMMQRILGYKNSRMLDADELHTSFTGWAMGQCMTFIEEIMLDNAHKYTTLNKLKPYISNEMVNITQKSKDPRTVPNTTNYLMFTNYRNAIPLDDRDRRYCVLFSAFDTPEKLGVFEQKQTDYFSTLYDDMRQNISELFEWLNEHKIAPHFYATKRAPMTNAKLEMIENTKPVHQVAFEQAVKQFTDFDINDNVINITKLNKQARNEFNDNDDFENYPNQRQIKPLLLSLGFKHVGRTKQMIDGDRYVIYAKEPNNHSANSFYAELLKENTPF